ncbi:universal stress protein [Sphingomonas lenta]|uniref:UspA domain-containing protein n=1 Tax=Sphingomonas lenta TaxID=1141887 RepID=A0A2A2SHY9_9SPHN|nr:universal stress protein [Sphingomonas lenta]PAX08852.1 hypothetical protein CKY28_05725 [Sphingomonas lenta]
MVSSRILVATDLSPRCDRAVDRAFSLAEQLSAELTVLHVASGDRADNGRDARLRDELGRQCLGRASLDQLLIERGPVPATIVRVARERRSDLILTGVARFNDVRDHVVGTAVEHLIRCTNIPILIVKQRATGPYSRLLAPVDFGPASRAALAYAFALFPAAGFHAVHVVPPSFPARLDQTELFRLGRAEAERKIEPFLDKLPFDLRSGLQLSILSGEINREIHRSAREWAADMLVLGAEDHSDLALATIGSRTVDLLRCEPADTLVVRAVQPNRRAA